MCKNTLSEDQVVVFLLCMETMLVMTVWCKGDRPPPLDVVDDLILIKYGVLHGGVVSFVVGDLSIVNKGNCQCQTWSVDFKPWLELGSSLGLSLGSREFFFLCVMVLFTIHELVSFVHLVKKKYLIAPQSCAYAIFFNWMFVNFIFRSIGLLE